MQLKKKRVAVSVSGGKDSLVALDLASRVGIRRAVFCDTTIEFDETVRYVDDLSSFYGIDIDVVRAPRPFFEVCKDIGFPSRRMRWCCDVFKFAPLARYAQENRITHYITGLRSEESRRRTLYQVIDKNPMVPVTQVNPIVDWSEKDIWEYIRVYGLPKNPLYGKLNRVGCWCCVYKTNEDWARTEKHFPHMMAKLNNALLEWAESSGVPDKETFVQGKGWTSYVTPLGKIASGTSHRLCGDNDGQIDVVLSFGSDEHTEKVLRLLPILSDNYRQIGRSVRVSIHETLQGRLRVLSEKAVNCIGCGACTATCSRGALFINGHRTIEVDEEKCTHCQVCITSVLLRGACIMRTYSPTRSDFLRVQS
jgi:phosphoadenosine phosphosulfate reductase